MKLFVKWYWKIKLFIIKLCKKHNIFEPAKRVYWGVLNIVTLGHYIKFRCSRYEKELQEAFEKFSQNIEDLDLPCSQNTIVFAGVMVVAKKTVFRKVYEELAKDHNVLLLSLQSDRASKSMTRFFHRIHASTLFVPGSLNSNTIFPTHEHPLESWMQDLYDSKAFIREAVENSLVNYPTLTKNHSIKIHCTLYRNFETLLSKAKVSKVVIWNTFKSTHAILYHLCLEHGVSVNMLEYGSLPGTFSLDNLGQMGESYPAVSPQEFMAQPVDDEMLEKADKIIETLRDSGENRYVQVQDDSVERIFKEKIKPNRPILLFTGQFDYDSGIIPYTAHAKKYHSPIFETSRSGAEYLAQLSEKNDWNFIYKPHPLLARNTPAAIENLPSNAIVIAKGDLNEIIDRCDVVLAVLSSVVYVSLIRDTPVVMFGYNQISQKDCTYDCYHEDQIENTIQKAIVEGYTPAQRAAFRKHVAQMEQYYLYEDSKPKELQYGKSFAQLIEDISKGAQKKAPLVNAPYVKQLSERKLLFVCHNLAELFYIISMKESLLRDYQADLFLLTEHDGLLWGAENNSVLLSLFRNVTFQMYDPDIDAQFLRDMFQEYTDVYLGNMKKLVLDTCKVLAEEHGCPDIHLYVYSSSQNLKQFRTLNVSEVILNVKSKHHFARFYRHFTFHCSHATEHIFAFLDEHFLRNPQFIRNTEHATSYFHGMQQLDFSVKEILSGIRVALRHCEMREELMHFILPSVDEHSDDFEEGEEVEDIVSSNAL